MKEKDLINSIDKIQMTKADEDEVWYGITECKTTSINNRIKYKSKMKFAIAACLAALCIMAVGNDIVRAYVYSIGTDFYNLFVKENNYDILNISTSGLEEPLTMSKNNITVTLNQCVFSDSEFLVHYYIKADGAQWKVASDIMNVGFEIYDGKKDVKYKLFKKYLSGIGHASVSYPGGKKLVKDKNVVEKVYVGNGIDFQYKGKTLMVSVYVAENGEKIDFPFEIKVDEFYKENSVSLDEKIEGKNGTSFTITKVSRTFTKIMIIGMGKMESPYPMTLLNASGERLGCSGIQLGSDKNPFCYDFTRNSSDEAGDYTLQIYDTDKTLIKEIPIRFEDSRNKK